MQQFVYGNIRVQLLSTDLVRVEYGRKGKFCDENIPFLSQTGQTMRCRRLRIRERRR